MFSTLKDNITLSLGEIGESLVKTFSIKKLMSGAIIAIDKMKNKWIALSEETKKRVLLMAALFAASGPLLIAFGVVIKAVVLLSKVFTSKFFMITALFGSVVVAGQWFVDNWTKISLGIENVTISIGSAFYQMGLSIMKAIREVIQFIIRKIPPVALAKLFGIDVDDWATEVIGIDSTIAKMEATISNGQQALKKGINKYNEIDFTSIGESAQNALKKIKESIEQLFGIRFDQLGAQALNSWNNFVDGLVAGSELSSEALKKARILEFGEGIGKKNLSLDLTPKMDLTKMYVQVPAFIEKTKEMSNAMMIATDIGNTFTNSFGQGMANIIVQGERVIDVFKNIGRLLASSVIQKGLSILLTGGLAGDGLFGSGGGILGRLFSGLGFATGGIPPVGKASIVGERGPELFIPGVRGTIIPNHQIGGSSGAGVGMLLPISINLNERVLYNALVKVQQKINK